MDALTHIVDGAPRAAAEPATLTVVDPSSGEPIATIPAGSAADAGAAVDAAARAYPGWSALPLESRVGLLADGVKRALGIADELAELQSREMGQPVTLAREFTTVALEVLGQVAQDALAYDFTIPIETGDGRQAALHRVPYGVGALVTPWNFPLFTAVDGLGRLLSVGSTVVWKPSERSPLSALRLAQALDLPAGVLNVLLGDGRSGAPLVEHPDVRVVVFTGSEQVGRAIGAACGAGLKPAMLELGGKDPIVVDAGVDPAWAAGEVARGAFLNTGQICTSMERVYVHREVADAFVAELVRRAEALAVGAALDPATEVGPLVDERQRRIVTSHVDEARSRGARVLTGGRPLDGPGFFYPPTVLVDPPDDCALMVDETFGPVAPVRVVDSFEEALDLARGSRYGLGATVLTADPAHAEQAARIPAACVWVNDWWGDAPGMRYEPAGASGLGTLGTFDTVTRLAGVIRAPAGPAAM